MTPLLLGLATAAAASVTGVFWLLKFLRVLPLERELASARSRIARLEADRDSADLRLSQKTREIKSLKEVTDAISAHPAQTDILGAIVAILAKALEADVCAFLLLDEATGDLVTQPGGYGIADDEGSLYRIPLKNQASFTVRAFTTGQSLLTGDAQRDPRVVGHLARLWKCHSLMVVPLRVAGSRIGVLRVGSHRTGFFNEDHLRFVEVIAEEAAVLVEGAVLTKRLTDMSMEMARLHGMKDEFVSTVSHEFKTPLTSIKGFLAVLLEEQAGPLNEEQRRFLNIARTSADRLAALVSDLLDLSRLENGLKFESRPVKLQELARQAVENHQLEAAKRDIRLGCSIQPELPPVKGDVQWLLQVFDNLVSNALKFTPAGGAVTVSLTDKGECLQASVADTGVGIDPEDQPHLFQKFYRARNRDKINTPGTGLGLAICKSVIDRHEGRIWVESKPGAGARFHFQVPVSCREPLEQGDLSKK